MRLKYRSKTLGRKARRFILFRKVFTIFSQFGDNVKIKT